MIPVGGHAGLSGYRGVLGPAFDSEHAFPHQRKVGGFYEEEAENEVGQPFPVIDPHPGDEAGLSVGGRVQPPRP